MSLTNPHNFQNSSKWYNSINGANRYSDFVNNILKPHINTQRTPPYYQGSYGIFSTTQQNKANNYNLRNSPDGLGISSTANVNLAAPLPKPGLPGIKLSDLSPTEYKEATVRKPVNFGRSNTISLVGASHSLKMGELAKWRKEKWVRLGS